MLTRHTQGDFVSSCMWLEYVIPLPCDRYWYQHHSLAISSPQQCGLWMMPSTVESCHSESCQIVSIISVCRKAPYKFLWTYGGSGHIYVSMALFTVQYKMVRHAQWVTLGMCRGLTQRSRRINEFLGTLYGYVKELVKCSLRTVHGFFITQ